MIKGANVDGDIPMVDDTVNVSITNGNNGGNGLAMGMRKHTESSNGKT